MGNTLNLQQIFSTLKKNWKLISLITILAAAATAGVSYYLITPVYGSSTQILISQEQSETSLLSNQSIEADLQLINTYSVIIKSPVVLDQVIEQLNLNTSVDELQKEITVIAASGSQVIDLSVKNENAATAVQIANSTAEIFKNEVRELMNINNVTILSPAALKANPVPVAPNSLLNTAMAAAVGLMLGVGMAFLREYLDTTIKDENDIEILLNVPLLATISPIADKKQVKERVRDALNEKEVLKYGQ